MRKLINRDNLFWLCIFGSAIDTILMSLASGFHLNSTAVLFGLSGCCFWLGAFANSRLLVKR